MNRVVSETLAKAPSLLAILKRFYWHIILIGLLLKEKDEESLEVQLKALPDNQQLLMPDLQLAKKAKKELQGNLALAMEMLYWIFVNNACTYNMMRYYGAMALEGREEAPSWMDTSVDNFDIGRMLWRVDEGDRTIRSYDVVIRERVFRAEIVLSNDNTKLGMVLWVDHFEWTEPLARFLRMQLPEFAMAIPDRTGNRKTTGFVRIVDLDKTVQFEVTSQISVFKDGARRNFVGYQHLAISEETLGLVHTLLGKGVISKITPYVKPTIK